MSRIRFALLIGYVLLIFAVSTRSNVTPPGPEFHFKDKLAHLVEYSVLGVLLFRAIGPVARVPKSAAFLLLLAIGASVAASDEMLQGTVPGRSKDVFDWVADVGGLITAIFLSMLVASARDQREVSS